MAFSLFKSTIMKLALIVGMPAAAGPIMYPPDIPYGSEFKKDKSAKVKVKVKASQDQSER